MKITELLKKESIALNVQVADKDETIDTLIDLLYKGHRIEDPIRVIPSCIVGSAIAGGLSMAFGCTLRAPHGGIFVLPTIGNPLMYALAIFIGAAVGGFMLSMLKKPLINGR